MADCGAVEHWGELPRGWKLGDVAGVAVDSRDRLFAFHRGNHPVLIFERDGRFLDAWGDGLFLRPHGLFIGPDDSVYCVDDLGHAVRKFTPDGKPLLAMETADRPAETGYVPGNFRTVRCSGPPFCYPTGLALAGSGEMYVTDGYGNARVHKFSAAGELLFSWGEPGSGPGQFVLPHGLCIDKEGSIYVADRENHRLQVFNLEGELIHIWDNCHLPANMCLDAAGNFYVAEMGSALQGVPGQKSVVPDAPLARLTIRDRAGSILAELGTQDPLGDGVFFAPHDIAIDSRGDLYVGEVAAAYSGGLAPPEHSVLRKYYRKSASSN